MIGRLKRLYAKRSAVSWIEYLRNTGMKIGNGTIIFAKPFEILIDTTRPWLIEIGENVQITRGVTILSHGYDWSVIKAKYGEILGSAGKVKIGNNCFIGMNTTILKNTIIGDNVIIGAGSLVAGGEFPSNCVIAGNPAKVICSLDEYYEKRKKRQLTEAKELVIEYYKTYGKIPNKSVLSEFFWLFEQREELENNAFIHQMNNMHNYKQSMDVFFDTKPEFDGYNKFVEYCLNDLK